MTAQMKKIVPRILLLTGVLALTACGINDGSTSTTSSSTSASLTNTGATVALQGQVADGYLEKAVVFLDRNGNKVLDRGEPTTITGPNGRFKLQVPTADAGKYPVLAKVVPGLTIDKDTGSPLANPLTFEAPVGQSQFISPMTTLVKNALDKTPGLTPAQADLQVRTAFGLGNQVPLSSDYIAAEQSGDPQVTASAATLHRMAQAVAAIMTTVETDVAANLNGAIPAANTPGIQALMTDIVMSRATQIAEALQPSAGGTSPTPQEVAAEVLTGIDPTTLNGSLLALYQQRLLEQNPVWDATPPQVTVESPTAGQPAPVDTKVSVTFDEPLNSASVPTDALTLAAPGHSVDGTVSYDATSRTLTFTPTSPLAADTPYTVTLAAGLADSTGNVRPQSTSWAFDTIADIAPPPPPAF